MEKGTGTRGQDRRWDLSAPETYVLIHGPRAEGKQP